MKKNPPDIGSREAGRHPVGVVPTSWSAPVTTPGFQSPHLGIRSRGVFHQFPIQGLAFFSLAS